MRQGHGSPPSYLPNVSPNNRSRLGDLDLVDGRAEDFPGKRTPVKGESHGFSQPVRLPAGVRLNKKKLFVGDETMANKIVYRTHSI